MSARVVEIRIAFGDDPSIVVLHRGGSSEPEVADVLGIEPDEHGQPRRVWFRALVHRPEDTKYRGWQLDGAISTIATRIDVPPDTTRRAHGAAR